VTFEAFSVTTEFSVTVNKSSSFICRMLLFIFFGGSSNCVIVAQPPKERRGLLFCAVAKSVTKLLLLLYPVVASVERIKRIKPCASRIQLRRDRLADLVSARNE